VYIHGTVRDNTGRKMSKSLGNSIDPQAIIKDFSADALRFSLMMVTATGQDVFLSDDKFEIGRNFLTKIWNAARFIQMNGKVAPPSPAEGAMKSVDSKSIGISESHFGAGVPSPRFNILDPGCPHPGLTGLGAGRLQSAVESQPLNLSMDEQFILARLDETIIACTDNLEQCRFNDYAKCLYEFVWHQFCDWHIEYVKQPLNSSDPERRQQALRVMHHVFERVLRLLHPLAPFITEELWHGMGYGAEDKTIQLAAWPQPAGKEKLNQFGVELRAVEYVESKHELIRSCRNLRQDCDIPSSARVKYVIKPENESAAVLLAADHESIAFLLRAESFDIEPKSAPKKALNAICPLGTIFIPIEGLVDIAQEIKKHNDQLGKLDKDLAAVENKLNNADFIAKAPAKVVDVQRERQRQILEQCAKVRHVLDLLAEAES